MTKPINGQPATHGNGSTLGFTMQSPEQANAFHAAGVANGGSTCEDPPGWREGAVGKLYLAYLRDPDGNNLRAAPARQVGRRLPAGRYFGGAFKVFFAALGAK